MFASLLLNDRHRYGSRSLCDKIDKLIKRDFLSLDAEHRPTFEQYMENFYESSGGKAVLKRIKQLSIVASVEMLEIRDFGGDLNTDLWWDNEGIADELIRDYTPMSDEARRAFYSVMKTNHEDVHHKWVSRGQRHESDWQIDCDVGDDIRDTMFETMFRMLNDRLRMWTYTL
jgi:hypothetical protein